MLKNDNTQTRMQMLKMSFEDNTRAQIKELLNNCSIRDLYDMQSHAELCDIVGRDDGKLTKEQLELVLEVLNEKGNDLKDSIWKLVCAIGELIEIDGVQEEDIRWRAKLIQSLRKELPRAALKEIDEQFPQWKRYFKYNWAAIRKKYIGK